jgi:hypothetical protein
MMLVVHPGKGDGSFFELASLAEIPSGKIADDANS